MDIDFYEKADAFFDRMGRINHDALNPLLAQHFRIGPFGEFDRTRIASVVAVDAWKIAKPIFFQRHVDYMDEWQRDLEQSVEFSDDDTDEHGNAVAADGYLRYVNQTPKQVWDEKHAVPNESIFNLCRNFATCYALFAGNNARPASDTNGCLVPKLHCPFGKHCSEWRKNELNGFDVYITSAECNHQFPTFASLMKHLAGVSCAIHQAAFAFMEVMYCSPEMYCVYLENVQRNQIESMTDIERKGGDTSRVGNFYNEGKTHVTTPVTVTPEKTKSIDSGTHCGARPPKRKMQLTTAHAEYMNLGKPVDPDFYRTKWGYDDVSQPELFRVKIEEGCEDEAVLPKVDSTDKGGVGY